MQLSDIPHLWIPWAESALMGILLLICILQPKAIAQSLQTLSAPIRRRYTSGNNHWVLALLKAIFQLGTVSLTLLMAVSTRMGQVNGINAENYLLTMGILLAVMLIKALIDKWIQFTFRYTVNEPTYYSYRSDLWQIMSILLWVVLLICPWISEQARWITPVVVISVYYIILWWKLMQAFGWSITHITYSILYMVHAEIVPIVVAVEGIVRLEFRV